MAIPVDDTICALATPAGTGGIGVIRVSGPDAFAISDRILRQHKPTSSYRGHTLHRALIVAEATGDVIDDALISIFHAPSSYTGEDVVELSCHGGPAPLRRTLAALLGAGARMAEPGEFTLRAFLNGKMDLAQAEAVCDIISARTEEALRLAHSQQSGRLSKAIQSLRDDLLGVLARIEASIDFPEDVGELDAELCSQTLSAVRIQIARLLATADSGILFREGALVVLAGRPNAGKSSLMNALLRTSRAIVTPVPGTTRDVIEETLNVHGIPVRLADTAGLRETDDVVERIGVDRTRQTVEEASLVLMVLDGSGPLAAEDHALLESLAGRKMLAVENKSDIASETLPRVDGAVVVSALLGSGLAELEDAIARELRGASEPLDLSSAGAIVTHARHRNALRLAGDRVDDAFQTIEAAMPPDFLAIDVRGAITALEEITGVSTPDDIINEIFSRFCIGK